MKKRIWKRFFLLTDIYYICSVPLTPYTFHRNGWVGMYIHKKALLNALVLTL